MEMLDGDIDLLDSRLAAQDEDVAETPGRAVSPEEMAYRRALGVA